MKYLYMIQNPGFHRETYTIARLRILKDTPKQYRVPALIGRYAIIKKEQIDRERGHYFTSFGKARDELIRSLHAKLEGNAQEWIDLQRSLRVATHSLTVDNCEEDCA